MAALYLSVGDSLELPRIQFTPPRQTRHRQDKTLFRVRPGGINLFYVLLYDVHNFKINGLFTDTSEHVLFYFLVFFVSHFLVVGSLR